MPSILALPKSANAISYDHDDVRDTAALLCEAGAGNGVSIDDAQDSETKARIRGKRMRDLIVTAYGVKARVHAVPDGDSFVPALSVKSDQVDALSAALDAEDDAQEEDDDEQEDDS